MKFNIFRGGKELDNPQPRAVSDVEISEVHEKTLPEKASMALFGYTSEGKSEKVSIQKIEPLENAKGDKDKSIVLLTNKSGHSLAFCGDTLKKFAETQSISERIHREQALEKAVIAVRLAGLGNEPNKNYDTACNALKYPTKENAITAGDINSLQDIDGISGFNKNLNPQANKFSPGRETFRSEAEANEALGKQKSRVDDILKNSPLKDADLEPGPSR